MNMYFNETKVIIKFTYIFLSPIKTTKKSMICFFVVILIRIHKNKKKHHHKRNMHCHIQNNV